MDRRPTCREDIARLHKMRGGASLVVDNNRLVHTNVQLKNRHALNADDSCHASVPFLIDASMVRRRRCNDVDVEYRYDDRFYYFRYIIGPKPTIPNTRVTVYQCLQSLKKSRPIGSIAFAGEDGDNIYDLDEHCIDGAKVLKLRQSRPLISMQHKHHFATISQKSVGEVDGVFYFFAGVYAKCTDDHRPSGHFEFVEMTIDVQKTGHDRCKTRLFADVRNRFDHVNIAGSPVYGSRLVQYRGALIGPTVDAVIKGIASACKKLSVLIAIMSNNTVKELSIGDVTNSKPIAVIGRIRKYLLIKVIADSDYEFHLFAVQPNKEWTSVRRLIHIDMTKIHDALIHLNTKRNFIDICLDGDRKVNIQTYSMNETKMRIDRIDIHHLFIKSCAVCCQTEKKSIKLVANARERRAYSVTNLKVCKICKSKQHHKEWFKFKCHFCSTECFRKGWNRHKKEYH